MTPETTLLEMIQKVAEDGLKSDKAVFSLCKAMIERMDGQDQAIDRLEKRIQQLETNVKE